MAAGDIIVVNENSYARKGNYFDGVDDYVLHDAHAVARVAANDTVGTYTAWIYIDKTGTAQTILSAGDNNSGDEYLNLGLGSGQNLRVILRHGGATQFEVSETSASMSLREWHHIAVVQDGVQPLLYIDGLNVAATNITSTDLTFWYDELTLTDKFAIGVLESNNTHTADFSGAIGQVKYWNTNLSAAEIKIESQEYLSHSTERQTALDALLQFNITMNDDGTTDAGLGADNGTLTGNAHYGGEISTYSATMERNVTGHAAEDMNSFIVGDRIQTVIKRGD